jgi:hypothetical protein
MNRIFGVALVAAALVVTSIPQPASAQAGRVHRATRRRTAVVVGTTVNASDQEKAAASQSSAQQSTAAQQSATAQQQSATAAQQSATAQQQTSAAAKPAAAPAAAGALAVGTVASTLPAGCATSAVSGVEYYHCGDNWYRSAFQGNTLVYVTTAAPQ